jgi:hypothetical protein
MIYNLHTHNKNYAEIMRAVRDQLLAQSDWAMAPDAPTDKTAWATYRQALRDYPATWKVAETADFPEMPA